MRPFCFLACILIHFSKISPCVNYIANWCTILAFSSKRGPDRGAQAMHFCKKVLWTSGVGSGFSLTKYDSGTTLTPNTVNSIFSNPVIHSFHFWLSFNLPGDALLLTELASFASCFQMVDLCAATPEAALKDDSDNSLMLVISITIAKSFTQCIINLRRLVFCRTNISLPSAAVRFEYEHSRSNISFLVNSSISSNCSMSIWSAYLLGFVSKPIHVSVHSILSMSSSSLSSSLILNHGLSCFSIFCLRWR